MRFVHENANIRGKISRKSVLGTSSFEVKNEDKDESIKKSYFLFCVITFLLRVYFRKIKT